MIVTNNTLFSLNFITGTWQTEFGLLLTVIYVYFVYANAPLTGDEALYDDIQVLSNYIAIYHVLNMVLKFILQVYPVYTYFTVTLLIADCIFYLSILICVSS
jgi:hypothetical protein